MIPVQGAPARCLASPVESPPAGVRGARELLPQSRRRLTTTVFLTALGMTLIAAPSAPAEPLTPLSPAENEYLTQLRHVFSQYRDPTEFRGDGELLDLGRMACAQRDNGLAGYEATLITPAVVQLAFIYLCPR